MELVYLWVEEYKNIRNQGFNFSPRFECEFDGENLTITENKDYMSIFPDKINVTAIVGENGSGKSNILEILFGNNIDNDCKFFYIVDEQNKNGKTTKITAYNFDDKMSIHFDDKMSIHFKELKLGKSYKLSDFQNLKKPIDKFSTLFYSNFPYIDNMSNQNSNIENAKNLAISEKETYLTYKLKSIEYAISMIKNNANFEKLLELPKKITIGIKEYQKPEFCKKFKKSIKFIDKVKIAIICEIYKKRPKEVDKETIDCTKELDTIFSKIIEMPVLGGLKEDVNKFIKEAENINEKYNTSLQINIDNLETNFVNAYHIMVDSFFNLNIDLNILNFSWYPNLSTGQETYLLQFANLYNAMKKNDTHSNCIILIDEGECTLHPNWQKMYIKYIIDFFQKNMKTKKNHIIFSSHSPFILSDIPKENVIFLDKFDEKAKEKYPKLEMNGLENGNCINVSKHVDIKTFGANIHTLLSDGFFMSDGLMGEFAKVKITEILEFLNNEKKLKSIKKKQIKSIIESIGEDFLRNKLLNLYYKKFNTDKQHRIKELKNELKRLEK
ncbi:MAG: AAA family ATPase [Arcobacteraceae bacterium]